MMKISSDGLSIRWTLDAMIIELLVAMIIELLATALVVRDFDEELVKECARTWLL